MQAPDREQQLQYNLTVLKRRDGAITKIIDMAGHVVLYQFNEDSKAWDRKGVEGSLFVVERSTEPRYQFVVLNRLSSENLVETVDADFQTELTEQFLLYRNLKQEILGVWFYSPPERSAISELLTSLTTTGEQPPVAADVDDTQATAPPAAAAQPDAGAAGFDAAQFFSMAATSAQSGAPAPPPMPPAVPPTSAPTAPAAPAAPAPAAKPAVDVVALKAKLASQLRSLVDDDAFLSLLANEYLRQQQRALQQAQQNRQRRAATAEAAATAMPTPDASSAMPAHLAGLFAQQASM
mmetsp:Transcript_15411/g.39710  ORF Transcript_15411/g.39710 Transcript_15411/m.39710 type:complete len:294 (+) Transcript_15411:85-966(+)|eukprot:CAMPEP_0115885512 /NCGR_PEP_ID=MMETSP0287-20121206/30716_1 /TAXON_ID=412157 /ORGANISM="Chrysochromulina rotalis, Strain UIO044" /LENGTH=293 /DNA_ID=CAMNT_0003341939 /DNA_START=76 /DNA_END=957 /DNA_ORIENTATION=-